MIRSLSEIEKRRRYLQYLTFLVILILTITVIGLLFFIDSILGLFASLKYNLFLRLFLVGIILSFIYHLSRKEREGYKMTKELIEELQRTTSTTVIEQKVDGFLAQVSNYLTNPHPEKALEKIFKLALEFLQADGGAIILRDKKTGWRKPLLSQGNELLLAGQVATKITQMGRPVSYPSEGERLASETASTIIGAPLKLKNTQEGVIILWRLKPKGCFRQKDLDVLEGVSRQVATSAFDLRQIEEKNRQFKGILQVLAEALEERDPQKEKISEISKYASKIAETMNLIPEEVEAIEVASLLQNVGLAAPKRKNSLEKDEKEILRTHPTYGAKLLKEMKFPRRVTDIVLTHHERLDGSGYPQGLKDGQIPMGSKIIAVANDFLALIAEMTKAKALKEIEKGAGSKFDPEVVKAFIELQKGSKSE